MLTFVYVCCIFCSILHDFLVCLLYMHIYPTVFIFLFFFHKVLNATLIMLMYYCIQDPLALWKSSKVAEGVITLLEHHITMII